MKSILYFTINALCAAMLLFSAGCEHKELCNDHSHTATVKVVFDWKNAPDAAPASMSLYLFPLSGGEALRYEFTDQKGGTIRVPIGHYDAFCLNSDTETISYRNTERRETFEATTRTTSLLGGLSALGVRSDGAPRPEGTEDERIALSPDMLWSDHTEGVELTRETATTTITLYPKVSVCIYTVKILNAENLKYVSGISGSIASLAGGLLPGMGPDALTEEHVTIPFEAVAGEDEKGEKTIVTGGLLTFGHCPSVQSEHRLTVYAVLSDGSKWYYTYNVTDQIHSAPDPRNVHIVLDGLPLPKPITNGGGFQPEVDPWNPVDIEIEM